MGTEDFQGEWLKCRASAAYFIHAYCNIYDATEARWIPFHLWDDQYQTLTEAVGNRLLVVLKARQLGFTWLFLCYALWLMVFHPEQTIMLFSRREDEAIYLLKTRLKGIYNRLPGWLGGYKFLVDSQHEWRLDNGSVAYAFPTTAGDSYTASFVLVDEADLITNLDDLMNAVKPTIDGGGRMILLSRSNKDYPQSTFKRIYRAAKKGESGWKSVFVPWWARPERDAAWYEAQKTDVFSRTGSLDDLYQQYPATDMEALSPRSMAKRLPQQWLKGCTEELTGLASHSGPAINYLKVYREPIDGFHYVIGADPAEGNPTSDDSSLTVLDRDTGEEVALLSGKIETDTFSAYIVEVSKWFNRAEVLVERNNHGHAVISWINNNASGEVELLKGLDGSVGWQTTGKSKAAMYTTAAESFRDGFTKLHSFETYVQLSSIEGSTLRAPKNEHDDQATSYVLALQAIFMPTHQQVVYDYVN